MTRRLNKRRFFADLGYEPHEGQAKIHFSKAPRRVVACGVRWGKTLCAAMEGLAAAMAPAERSVGWVVAPTYDLADKVFREIVLLVAQHLRHHIVSMKENEKRLILRNMGGGLSEIRAKSADNPVSLLGEGLDFVIVDEAARLKPMIWEGHLSQRLLDKRGWALLISTPRGKGWFYETYRRGQGRDNDYESWNYPSWTSPFLDRDTIEAERARLPERVFEQEYGGRFLEGSGSVFRNVRGCATGAWQPPLPGMGYIAGLDLARTQDWSVLAIMNHRREVVYVDRFQRLDWSEQVNRIYRAVTRYPDTRVLVDATGVGDPIYEILRSSGLMVEPFTLTARTKSAVIDNLAILLERGEITLPTPELWPEGIDELESYEYSVTDAGHVRSSAPSGTHDDCVIALALACWPLRPHRPMPRIRPLVRRELPWWAHWPPMRLPSPSNHLPGF